MAILDDTICAPATVPGTGAVSVVRVSGPDALRACDAVVSLRRGCCSDAPGYSLRYGQIAGLDDVMVSIFRAPHSYTGEDSVEITCHASSYIVSEILARLCANGCRMAEPGEFTRRAFAGGKMDLAQAEAVADIIAADSEASHRLALTQMRGGYSKGLREVRDSLLRLSTLLELELDFSEEEVEFADREELRVLADSAQRRCRTLSESFKAGNAIKNGIPVAIVGAPNSGKSTLLNALLGDERAIVSPIAGTTRDTVEDVVVIGGVKFRLIDTAGLRESDDAIEAMGIERTRKAANGAMVVLGVVDGTSPDALDECSRLAAMTAEGQVFIPVWNKADLGGVCVSHGDGLRISALRGDGLDELRSRLVDAAGPLDRPDALVSNARHAAALGSAAASLRSLLDGLRAGLPGDLLAEDLRCAIASLNSILGDDLITPQETLNRIFEGFCIGK